MQEFVDRIGIPNFIQVVIELWSGVFLLLMIFSLAIKLKLAKDKPRQFVDVPYTKEIAIFYCAILLYNLCNAAGIAADGNPSVFYVRLARVSDFLYYVLGAFQTLFFLQLIKRHIALKNGNRRLEKAALVMQLLHVPLLMLLAVTPFTGLLYYFNTQNIYCRGRLFFLWNGITIASFVFIFAVYLAEHKRTEVFLRQIICTAALIPACGILLNTVSHSWISFNNISVSVAAFIIFMFYEQHRTAASIAQLQELERTKTELAENKLALEQRKNTVLMAQIQPHFINSYLISLRAKSCNNPELYDSVTNFTRYMRAHFDSLSGVRMISFEKEMESVEAYLALESENFGDRLSVEYNIDCDSFLIPAFSVQPLVENAVRHGIATFDQGGTVRICVRKQDDIICIEITDSGVGSSNITQQQAARKQIGYDHVRARLRSVLEGELRIVSDEHGTAATVILPNGIQEVE